MQEFEVERKPQRSYGKPPPIGFIYEAEAETGKRQRDGEGWGKEGRFIYFMTKGCIIKLSL